MVPVFLLARPLTHGSLSPGAWVWGIITWRVGVRHYHLARGCEALSLGAWVWCLITWRVGVRPYHLARGCKALSFRAGVWGIITWRVRVRHYHLARECEAFSPVAWVWNFITGCLGVRPFHGGVEMNRKKVRATELMAQKPRKGVKWRMFRWLYIRNLTSHDYPSLMEWRSRDILYVNQLLPRDTDSHITYLTQPI